jgi:hypothetical protein
MLPKCSTIQFILASMLLVPGACAPTASPSPVAYLEPVEPSVTEQVSTDHPDADVAVADVAVVLFVLDPTASGGGEPSPLRGSLAAAGVCPGESCRVLFAPSLLGRSGFPMLIEVGDAGEGRTFRAKVHVRKLGPHVDVDFDGALWGDAFHQNVVYRAAAPTGELVHLGTLSDVSGAGPQVYGVFAHGEPTSLRRDLEPWIKGITGQPASLG